VQCAITAPRAWRAATAWRRGSVTARKSYGAVQAQQTVARSAPPATPTPFRTRRPSWEARRCSAHGVAWVVVWWWRSAACCLLLAACCCYPHHTPMHGQGHFTQRRSRASLRCARSLRQSCGCAWQLTRSGRFRVVRARAPVWCVRPLPHLALICRRGSHKAFHA
jgi:hypothetical protein